MEPVGATGRQPLVSDITTVRSAGETRKVSTGSAGAKTGDVRFGVPSGYGLEQKGLQPSSSSAHEFRPYSRSGLRKDDGSGAAQSLQKDAAPAGGTEGPQDPQIQAEIGRLKATEEKVKAHESAHKSAGGTMTGPVSYTYTRGPDGRNYITGGEVPIAVSPGKTPQETIARMQQVIRAALAPADPSPQDRAVAAQASAQQQEASRELATAAAPAVPGAPPPEPSEVRGTAESIVARESKRAYGNHAVTGKQSGSAAAAGPASADSQTAAASSRVETSSPLKLAGTTGFGDPRPLSYYA